VHKRRRTETVIRMA